MHASIPLLLIAALTCCARCNDGCTENLICPPDAPEICVLHSELYCFIKYDNSCIWNAVRCKYNLNYQIYDIKFCSLENFICTHSRNKHNE